MFSFREFRLSSLFREGIEEDFKEDLERVVLGKLVFGIFLILIKGGGYFF